MPIPLLSQLLLKLEGCACALIIKKITTYFIILVIKNYFLIVQRHPNSTTFKGLLCVCPTVG